VNATLDLLEGEFRARTCTLERDGLAGPYTVALDGESLRQVVLNLVLNALEAVPAGGRVRVALARHGAAVELRVEDDGPGFRPRCSRGRGTVRDHQGAGHGLGLFLSRRLVEAPAASCAPGGPGARGRGGRPAAAGGGLNPAARWTIQWAATVATAAAIGPWPGSHT